jgi:hypothetical protein
MKNLILMCIVALFFCNCVSVNLPNGKTKRAEDVIFDPPKEPFKEISSTNADKTWISDKTGNTISYLSECGGADPTLPQMESDLLSAMNKLNIQQSEDTEFNSREARRTVATGEVDGVAVQLQIMVFKKNGCNYTLSYGGVHKKFGSEQKIFDAFLKSFKAP